MEWDTLLYLLPLFGFLWPWQQADPESGVLIDTSNKVQYGPYLPPDWDSGEFGVLQPVANVVTRVTKNLDRMAVSSVKDPAGQTDSPAWYNIFGKAAQSTADFTTSTLNRVIIIVIVTAVAALFIMSYVQAKGASLAK